MTMHEEWTDRFSDYLDDELPADERRAVERHVAECDACAAILAGLRRVVDTAKRLPHRTPGEHVWTSIAATIRDIPRPGEVRAARRFAFTVPQLAAAGILLALLSGWAALRITSPAAPVSNASLRGAPATPDDRVDAIDVSDSQYDAAVSDLEQALQRGRGRLDAATIATVEDDLRIIDGALEEARRALMADPANAYLSGHVVETRQRKLDLLRRAAALTADSQM
jgi:anti-sigma factor RsiW